MPAPSGYTQHTSGYWYNTLDQSGPYTFDGTTMALASPSVTLSAATDSGGSVKIGGPFNTTLPTVTTGQRVDAQFSNRGELLVSISQGAGVAQVTTLGADGAAASPALRGASYLLQYNGTNWDRTRGDTNGLVVQPGLSSTFWNYAAAASGIVNTTTAVTIKAAAGAGVRNYLKSLTIETDALGSATELVIRDGAAGTVMWRGKLGTAALPGRTITFDPPLRGTANTLMEVATLTATVTGGVYVNATGYTGA